LALVVHAPSLEAKPWHIKPTCRNFYRRIGAHAEFDGGVLGGDLIVNAGSRKWSGNLDDRADVAACGEAWRRV
jgi:hypothetical protein